MDKTYKEKLNTMKKNECVEMTDTQKEAICYKSKLLNKYFDNYDEMLKAEDAYNKEHEEELKAKQERKALADSVANAYKAYLDVCEKTNKEVAEAKKAYFEERQKFINKYGYYHMTYTNNNGEKELSLVDSVNDFFNLLRF